MLKDVWQNITLVTHPDHRTGRRGNRLSICASGSVDGYPRVFFFDDTD